MAFHLRRQIRDYAYNLLLSGSTSAGSHVFKGRMLPMQESELPSIKVDTKDEAAEMESMGVARRYLRKCQLVCVVSVKEFATYNDTADEICRQIEVLFAGDNTLGGLCKYIGPPQFTLAFDERGEYPIAIGTLTFEVTYVTPFNAPDTPA